MSDLDAIIARLDVFERVVLTAIDAGLADGMGLMEQTAQATTSYRDDTGATRAGTVGYAPGVNDQRFAAASAAASALRPGHTVQTTVASAGPDVRTGILTAVTDYADQLEIRGAPLESALRIDATLVTQTIARASREVLG